MFLFTGEGPGSRARSARARPDTRRPWSGCSSRHLAQPLDEAPAVAFEVERLVGAIVRAMVVQRTADLRTCLARELVVRIDVVDVHADVVARGAGRFRTE